MFFGTQEQLTFALDELTDLRAVVFSMRGVPNIDDSAIGELEAIYDEYSKKGIKVLFCGVQIQVKKTMGRAGFCDKIGEDKFLWDAVTAIEKLDSEMNLVKA